MVIHDFKDAVIGALMEAENYRFLYGCHGFLYILYTTYMPIKTLNIIITGLLTNH